MSYQTGISSSPVNLLTTLETFLAANGWTLDSSVADGTTSQGWRLHMHRSGVYLNMRAATNELVWLNQAAPGYALNLYLGTAYSGASAWKDQAGGPIGNASSPAYNIGAAMNLPSGAVTAYHFFCDSPGDNVMVVVEKTPGIFTYVGFGVSILTAGTITGGPYFFGAVNGFNMGNSTVNNPGVLQTALTPSQYVQAFNDSNGFIRADVDSFTGKWLCTSLTTFSTIGYTGKRFWSAVSSGGTPSPFPQYGDPSLASTFAARQISAMNAMANLLPLRCFAERDVSGYSLLGTIPNAFYTNAVGKGFSPGAEYVLGADTYKLFPNFAVKKIV